MVEESGALEAPESSAPPVVEESSGPKHRRIRHKPSKRMKKAASTVDRNRVYAVMDAVRLMKGFKSAKFDESVELHVKLNVNAKKVDQQIRGTFSFPHGIGGEKRVIAFAEGEQVKECIAAGAVEVGGPELAQKILDGFMDFDVVIAHPGMMRHIGKLGRVLGPRGLMPNPKAGTVTSDVATAVKEFKAGKVEYRLDEGGSVHVVVGKKSMDEGKLSENISAFLTHMEGQRPSSVRGLFCLRATVAATMSPGVRVELSGAES